jgi:predicted CXXCH cytochrome family protein
MQGFSGCLARSARARFALALLACLLVSFPASARAVVRRAPAPAPAPVAAFSAPAGFSVTAGDMADTLRWTPVRSSGVAGYRIERATSASGPWAVVSKTDRPSVSVRVTKPGVVYYRASALDRRGAAGKPSSAVANTRLSMTRVVGSSGATLRASNGAMTLVFAPGTFAGSTRVTVTDASASTPQAIVRVTGAFDFRATAALLKPARITLPYRIPVQQFQVANTVAKGVDWMCLDAATGKWVPVITTVNTTAGTITAEMPHFSYWIGAFIQPHGTTSAKTDYCGYLCHELVTAPGSPIVVANDDSQVCYNCHGNSEAALPAAGSSGHNIQAEFYACDGQSPSGSMHPARLPGDSTGLTCVSCHDPHKDPTASPKLLRAYDAITGKAIASANATMPGTPYCWACHGVRKNAKADAQVPDYWTRAGDKKTTFNGAHTALGAATWRYGTEAELKRGYAGNTEVRADGSVAIAGTIMLPKTPAPPVTATPVIGYSSFGDDPLHAYDGLMSTDVQWYAHNIGANGASEVAPLMGEGYLTIDLGSATSVTAIECYMYNPGFPVGTWSTDVLEIQASDDNATWRTIAVQGVLGTRLGDYISFSVSDTCRFVRLGFRRRFTNSNNSIGLSEVSIYGPPSQGTYEVWPDIARKATFVGGVVRWTAIEPASTSLSVSVRASTDRGSTWTAWQSISNGGALTQIPTGASLENARLQVRSTLGGVGDSPVLDSLEITINRGAITGTTPQWSGASPANQCQRCHTGHSSTSGGLVSDASTTACKTCHAGTYGSSYVGSAAFAASKHASVPCADCHTAHGAANAEVTSYAFLLRDDRGEACLACHTTVKAAVGAKEGVASEWSKHDIRSAEQVKTGSTLACRSCHGTHFSSTGLVDPISPATAFTTMRDDPTSIPTGEVVIEATRDALLDSTSGQQSWNYGASTEVTITPATRLLAYFDLSAIPAGATIQNATLVLWGREPATYTGGYAVYPMTRDWLEGTGTGTLNDASVNGSTWLEWKYGDNANTGNVASGDWAASGGDNAASPYASKSGINALSVTAFVTSLRQGTNYGIMIAPSGAGTSLPIYTRHNAAAQYRPRLRVVYRTGPATQKVVDDITFCSKCHSAGIATGVTGHPLRAVGASYGAISVHGGAKGLGPESAAFGSYAAADNGGGYLKAPYSYGMDALPCTTCHDPHGSRLPYHLRETLNGRDMTPLLASGWNYESISAGAGMGYFCGACHVFPTVHAHYETMGGDCFNSCHCSSH